MLFTSQSKQINYLSRKSLRLRSKLFSHYHEIERKKHFKCKCWINKLNWDEEDWEIRVVHDWSGWCNCLSSWFESWSGTTSTGREDPWCLIGSDEVAKGWCYYKSGQGTEVDRDNHRSTLFKPFKGVIRSEWLLSKNYQQPTRQPLNNEPSSISLIRYQWNNSPFRFSGQLNRINHPSRTSLRLKPKLFNHYHFSLKK